MRTYCLFFIVIFFGGCQSSSEDKNRTESIPFIIVEGYGPFVPSFGLLAAENKQSGWAKTYESPKGIPKNWHHVIQGNIWLDPHQFVYQHFKKGNIDKGMYEYLQQSWKWVPDTTQLTSTFIILIQKWKGVYLPYELRLKDTRKYRLPVRTRAQELLVFD